VGLADVDEATGKVMLVPRTTATIHGAEGFQHRPNKDNANSEADGDG